ncbi:hypothetical protein KQQSB11_300251 [Klebsiella quasipneumoniae subsp. quasipneumoniae]|nr:hypothetical protein KQQSB11_300251 [Klebsiella quasipneumoniae subsp. quasipneumoniae]
MHITHGCSSITCWNHSATSSRMNAVNAIRSQAPRPREHWFKYCNIIISLEDAKSWQCKRKPNRRQRPGGKYYVTGY